MKHSICLRKEKKSDIRQKKRTSNFIETFNNRPIGGVCTKNNVAMRRIKTKILRLRYKQCKAREGQKDEIDLVGHRSLLPEAVTQQCAVYKPQKNAARNEPRCFDCVFAPLNMTIDFA